MAINRAVLRAISSRTTNPFSLRVVPLAGEVDDSLGQPGQRRELDRALDLDDLRLAARSAWKWRVAVRAYFVATASRRGAGGPRRPGRLAGDVASTIVHGRSRGRELYSSPLVLLGQDVLAGDAEVGGARLDVGLARPTGAS